MKLLFSATNPLNKWLKADLPRLPSEEDKQAGVNTLKSDACSFCWQAHIIDNRYQSFEKTLVACEANSRFTLFLPIDEKLTLQGLTETLLMEWQAVLAETLVACHLLSGSEIALLLHSLSETCLTPEWVKNTDLSINGHITDAGLWVTDTLEDRRLTRLPPNLALDLAIHLNTQVKRIKQRKEKFVPVECLLEYCQSIPIFIDQARLGKSERADNLIRLSDYRPKE